VVKLHHEVAGSGRAVVLLHEGIADSRMWDEQMDAFSDRFRVVRYDMRGFGRSELPPGPFSNVGDLQELLAELGIERASLVGVSLGGRVALELALVHPALTERLVLVAPGLPDADWSDDVKCLWAEEEELIERGDVDGAVELNLRMWVDGPSRGPDEVDPAVRERVREMQRRAFELQIPAYAQEPRPGPEERLDPPASARLGEIQAPTLVAVGDLDQPDMLRVADRLAAEIPGARKAVISGTAHCPSMEKPEEFNRLVVDFLG
jgi:3-oxoadipate enol-lactonase